VGAAANPIYVDCHRDFAAVTAITLIYTSLLLLTSKKGRYFLVMWLSDVTVAKDLAVE